MDAGIIAPQAMSSDHRFSSDDVAQSVPSRSGQPERNLVYATTWMVHLIAARFETKC
jgi:hypothetical protein